MMRQLRSSATGIVRGSPVRIATSVLALSAITCLATSALAAMADDVSRDTSRPVTQSAAAASRDALFGDDPPKGKPAKPESREGLFGDDVGKPSKPQAVPEKSEAKLQPPKDSAASSDWRGYLQTDFAYTYGNPEHWSKLRGRFELGRQGRLSDTVKYKFSGRIGYDAVFDVESGFYPSAVRNDQRKEFQIRETYLDISAGNWEFRVGRQHVVWGEVPGLFFADVVSAKDLREFLLPEFDSLRIPQWAARAEYFAGSVHLEALWIPFPTIDKIGKPGGDFYPLVVPPLPPGVAVAHFDEQKPSRSLRNSNFGLRASTLQNGWDMSAFAYRSVDSEANFYRQVVNAPGPTLLFQPSHDRITQIGGTLAKDLGDFVLKAEAVYNRGKGFTLLRLNDPTGVARLDYVDYLIGADFGLTGDTRLNLYLFQRYFTKYDADVIPDRLESGITALLTHKFSSTLEAQALFITSFNREDWAFRPKLVWGFAKNWRMNVGLDVLHGPALGFFGRFAQRDRIYADVRYSF